MYHIFLYGNHSTATATATAPSFDTQTSASLFRRRGDDNKGGDDNEGELLLRTNDSHIFFVQNNGDADKGGASIEEYLTIIACN